MSDERPYFAFEGDLAPVPSQPTHCTGCGKELEPMRRYGGRCRDCVRVIVRQVGVLPSEQPSTQFKFLRAFYKQRPKHKERFVEVQCSCGRKRTLQWSTWMHHRPACCNKCRLKAVERNGFEAEYAR
jgi:hypothetical protein